MAGKKTASSSKPREVAVRWSDDMTSKFLELYVREMKNNNSNSKNISKMSKDKIVEEFNAAMGMDLDWIKFKNRYDHLRKFYDMYRRLLTCSGVNIDPVTKEIIMDNSWWRERIEENHDISRLRANPLKDIDLLDQIFGDNYMSPSKGWNTGRGSNISEDRNEDTRALTQDYELEDPIRVPNPTPSLDPMSKSVGGSSSTSMHGGLALARGHVGPSGRQRKRTAFERMWTSIANSYKELSEVIKKQHEETIKKQPEEPIKKQHRENMGTIPGLMEAIKLLDSIIGIIPHSKLYWESVKLLETNNAARDVFLAFKREESRIQYLEMKTGVDRHMGLDDATMVD